MSDIAKASWDVLETGKISSLSCFFFFIESFLFEVRFIKSVKQQQHNNITARFTNAKRHLGVDHFFWEGGGFEQLPKKFLHRKGSQKTSCPAKGREKIALP